MPNEPQIIIKYPECPKCLVIEKMLGSQAKDIALLRNALNAQRQRNYELEKTLDRYHEIINKPTICEHGVRSKT